MDMATMTALSCWCKLEMWNDSSAHKPLTYTAWVYQYSEVSHEVTAQSPLQKLICQLCFITVNHSLSGGGEVMFSDFVASFVLVLPYHIQIPLPLCLQLSDILINHRPRNNIIQIGLFTARANTWTKITQLLKIMIISI